MTPSNITEEEFEEMKARCDKALGREPAVGIIVYPEEDKPDPGPESVLQGKIMKYCKQEGFPCQCFRKSKKAKGFLVPGWPDCVIALPGPRTLYLELKSESGELRQEQRRLMRLFLHLGHEWHKVKSYKRFLEIVKGGETHGSSRSRTQVHAPSAKKRPSRAIQSAAKLFQGDGEED